MHFSRNRSTARNVVRLPAVAGDFRGFYPSTPSILSEQVGELIDNADVKPTTGELIGLIAPHASYAYSGHVAGNAYKLLERKSSDTVILIGLSHRYRGRQSMHEARFAHRLAILKLTKSSQLKSSNAATLSSNFQRRTRTNIA